MATMKKRIRYEETPERQTSGKWWHWLLSPAGGILTALAFYPFDFSQVIWVAMLPLLTALWCGPAKFWRGLMHGWLYGMGYFCTTFHWLPEVATIFNIPQGAFIFVAYLPLFAYFSLQTGLWAGVTATLLRPKLNDGPVTTDMSAEQRKAAWAKWAWGNMATTLRSAAGCAALWVCVEWWRGHGHISFGWNSFGIAFHDGLALAQWAEFVGVYALSFIPVFTAVVIWNALRRCTMHFRGAGKAGRPWDFYATVIVIFCLFAGGLSMSRYYSPLSMMKRESTLQLPVMAVQINKDQKDQLELGSGPSQYGTYLRATMAAFNEIQQQTVKQAMEHPELGIIQQLPVWVVWPESAMGCPVWYNVDTDQLLPDAYTTEIFFGPEGLPMVREKVQQMGGKNFTLFAGVDEIRLQREEGRLVKRGMFNSLLCIPGDFDSMSTARKQHLMPFGEYLPYADKIDFIRTTYEEMTNTLVGDGIHRGSSTEPLSLNLPGSNESIGAIPAVCYEDTVGDLLRKFVRKGAQVIVNGSNDAWFCDSACGVAQARCAAFRCIELRRSMVRAANKGLTCSIAPNGAILNPLQKADGSPHLSGYSYAVLPVDRNGGFTLYALLGDWAVIACALLALLCATPAIIDKLSRRPRQATGSSVA